MRERRGRVLARRHVLQRHVRGGQVHGGGDGRRRTVPRRWVGLCDELRLLQRRVPPLTDRERKRLRKLDADRMLVERTRLHEQRRLLLDALRAWAQRYERLLVIVSERAR